MKDGDYMKLILRKNDSATSVLLFIYNNYSALTNKYTLKLSSLLEIMKAFGKNETAVRMSISRATKAKILKNVRVGNEVSYTLTENGKDAIGTWNEGAMNFWNRYQLRNKEWDGKWYLLNIDFKEDAREVRPNVNDELKQLGFATISTNAWISANHLPEQISGLIKAYGLEGNTIEVYGDMKVLDINQFVNEQFKIKALKTAYTDFINRYKDKLNEKTDFSNPEMALPLLHELGWNFFNIASEDPALPRNLIATWEGDEAAALMRELRKIILQSTNQYLEKFD